MTDENIHNVDVLEFYRHNIYIYSKLIHKQIVFNFSVIMYKMDMDIDFLERRIITITKFTNDKKENL